MIVRIANEIDIPNLRKLDEKDRYLIKELDEYHTLLDDDDYLSYFLKKKSIFIAENESKIVGFLIALVKKWTFHYEKIIWIEHVLVDRDYRKKGIAEDMLNHVIKYYIKPNPVIKFIYSTISPDNMASLNLSKKLGFKQLKAGIFFLSLMNKY